MELFIEDIESFLRQRQSKVNSAINELQVLQAHGNKLIPEEKDILIANIVAAIDALPEMSDRNLFIGRLKKDVIPDTSN